MTIIRKIHLWLTWLFLLVVPVQIFFAGLGAFGNEYEPHEMFGYTLVHLTIVLMLLTAAIGRLGWSHFGLLLALNLVFVGQVSLTSADEPLVAALHALIGFAYWPYTYLVLLPRARAGAAAATVAKADATAL